MSAVLTLQHWTQREGVVATLLERDDDDERNGAYSVAGAHFNVSTLTDVEFDCDGEGKPWFYTFSLGGEAELLVNERYDHRPDRS